MVLNQHAEFCLRSNIRILYEHLSEAIDECEKEWNVVENILRVNAYLCATINAVVSYIERLIEADRMQETDFVKALKFANNLQKHNAQLVRIPRVTGGIEFPICLENDIEILPIAIVWDDCIGLETKSKQQRNCYDNLFMQHSIKETLTPIVQDLLSGKY